MTIPIAFRSAAELTTALREKRISCLELLEQYLSRMERLNPALNAVVALDEEAARRKAEAADRAAQRGEFGGPLHGLPITIKDTHEVEGLPCTSGAAELENHLPARNSDAVQTLIDAGAIVVGKTNVPLYGGDIQTYNDVYGQTNNPWDESRSPGGSSGGAAAALAAGFCALELGSDIGGSIRIPAHFCGVYGHKPSFGIVPDRGHIPPPPGIFTGEVSMQIDIVVSGPMARAPEDLDLAMDLLVAPEASERKAWRIELPPPRRKKLEDYRIGLWLDDPLCPVDSGVGDALQKTVDALARSGAKILDRRPGIDFAGSLDTFLNLLSAVMGSGTPSGQFAKWCDMAGQLPEEDTSYLARHLRGATQRHYQWIRHDVVRHILRQQWADFFREYDLLLCPVAPVAALPHDHGYFYDRTIRVNGEDRPYPECMAWAGLVGVAGLPSTVAPVGTSPEGLPVGIQIVGPYLEDKTPIHLACLLKDIVGGFVPPPHYI